MMFLFEIEVFLAWGSEVATSNIKWVSAIISALYFPLINLDNTWNKFCCHKGYLFTYSESAHNKIFQIFNLNMGRKLFLTYLSFGFGSETGFASLVVSAAAKQPKPRLSCLFYYLLLHRGVRNKHGVSSNFIR